MSMGIQARRAPTIRRWHLLNRCLLAEVDLDQLGLRELPELLACHSYGSWCKAGCKSSANYSI